MELNLYRELKAFGTLARTSHLSANEKALWLMLTLLTMESGWQDWLEVDNRSLMSLIPTNSEKTAINTRNKLLEKGVLEFRRGKKGSPNKYRLKSIYCNFYSKYYSKNGSTNAGETTEETADIYNKQKQRNKKRQKNLYDDGVYIARDENFSGGEDVENSPREFLSELNCYFGMTDDIKQELAAWVRELFGRNFTRPASQSDMIKAFDRVRAAEEHSDGSWTLRLDEDRKSMLEYAFEAASAAGAQNWAYVDGVLERLRLRGLTNREECEIYDAEREYERVRGK